MNTATSEMAGARRSPITLCYLQRMGGDGRRARAKNRGHHGPCCGTSGLSRAVPVYATRGAGGGFELPSAASQAAGVTSGARVTAARRHDAQGCALTEAAEAALLGSSSPFAWNVTCAGRKGWLQATFRIHSLRGRRLGAVARAEKRGPPTRRAPRARRELGTAPRLYPSPPSTSVDGRRLRATR